MVSTLSIVLILLSSFLGASAALFVKKGTKNRTLFALCKSPLLLTGLFIYGTSALIYLFVLRTEQLSVVFPLSATMYIWSTILAVHYLHEKMNLYKWLGITGIILGVVLIGIGS
jgi:drug/metabolite transporter (DMT)-like permease